MSRASARRRQVPATLAAAMLDTGRLMSETRLSPGRSGNFSARHGQGMVITPTGKSYDALSGDDLVLVDGEGRCEAGAGTPSSEWRMHLAIYRARPDCAAIVHTHSRHATALACVHRPIPAFHYMVAAFGGSHVACAPYATYGSERLAQLAVKALGPRDACLLANHGSLALGADLRAAFDRARDLEDLAAQYILALQAGRPRLLSARDMKIVLKKFRTYGVPDMEEDAG
ncbi:MAG: class II aldolase/adducin family protein [Alphaproteobacteria bacterium]|nr:class II aldolase/adducin family protein [Alphaproteobacteria bacterium]